jgi:hypothetical protein
MTTKQETIAALKIQYPTLKTGSDEQGYKDLSKAEYEATIEKWADSELEAIATKAEAEAVAQAKLDAVDKLTALGIDPKALGL